MKEHPILFSGRMVRAIMAGEKSQTRRVVKGRALEWLAPEMFTPDYVADPENGLCPYGVPGDRLWVRETWGYRGSSWCNRTPTVRDHVIEYAANKARAEIRRADSDERGVPQQHCRCKPAAKGRDQFDVQWDHQRELERYWKAWRPSIFMPRWASRITLEVTAVRVERLQDITPANVLAEGVRPSCKRNDCTCWRDNWREGWNSINGKRAPWASNPWVWVVEFRRLSH